MLQASQLYKQRGTGASISISGTNNQPVGSCLSKYLAERLLRLHVLFCSSLDFEISGANLFQASVAKSTERLESSPVHRKPVKPNNWWQQLVLKNRVGGGGGGGGVVKIT